MEHKYKVISLFTGIGGFDFGFCNRPVVVHKDSILDSSWVQSSHPVFESFVELNQLPFEIVFQNDVIPNCKSVCELNGIESNYVVDDIERLIENEYRFPKADVVIGGFPCQDFSNCGKRTGLKSKRGQLYKSFVSVVKQVKPLIFVCENVQGLLTVPLAIQTIVNDFESIGYRVNYELIDCSNHGIPQKRKRVILMGWKSNSIEFEKTGWNSIKSNNRIQCAIEKYFAHLQSPKQTNDKSQKQYSNAKRLTKGQGQSVIDVSRFAPTIRSEHHGNIEFRNEDRRLTVRECALCQTFPPDFKFGSMTASYKQIGNALPPLLSYIIARKVYELLKRRCVYLWVSLLFAMHSRIGSSEPHTMTANQLGGQVVLLGLPSRSLRLGVCIQCNRSVCECTSNGTGHAE